MTIRFRSLALSLSLGVPLFAGAQATKPAPAGAAPSAATVLPVDPKVKIGTLPNGMRFYIRKNLKPEKRAELRLVVNAGSVLENDNQLGLAHYVEHMAFNGTTHFAKNDLVKYLQSIGVRFGADLNAYTGFDETVYILPIPTDTARIVDQAFTILEDWAQGLLFDSTEVVNERGVVREEWRLGKGAGDRMLHQWLPTALKGSIYAERLPIGNEQSIMSATAERLKSYYKTWYRPDLMAVVAVGDFDPAAIEAQIRKHFTKIPKAVSPKPRTVAGVPPNKEPLIGIGFDKEATSSDVELIFKLPVERTRTVGDYRRGLTERLYLGMLNARLGEISQKPDAPFLGAGASKGTFIGRTTGAFILAAGVKDGGIDAGLQALLLEAKRVDQFGFLQSELDREKQDMVRGYERAYAERDKTQSGALVGEYVNNYLVGEPIPGIEYEYNLVQKLVPTITLADVNTLARKWISDSNRVIIAQSPQKDSVKIPTQADLVAVFAQANKAPVTAYTENLSSEALLAKEPAPGRVVSTKVVPEVNVTDWRLSNGVRVLIKPTDFKADEVLFSAYSPGGSSLVQNADFMSAALATQIVNNSGLGGFNRVDLQKKLSGKAASASGSISGTSEGLNGRASPKDIETMFQLIYLTFTAPRLDTAAFQAFKNQVAPFLANRSVDPDEVFNDTMQVVMSQNDFRSRPMTPAVFAEVNPEKAFAFYKDRFSDASDFTFLFVGNVDTVSLKPLVEKYIASLPATNRKETFRDVGSGPPRGVVERIVRKGVEPKANTVILFTGVCEYTPTTRFAMRALSELVQIKLNESLREQLGGAYSPNAGGGCSRLPRQEYTFQVQFNSSPENVEKLTKSALAVIDTIKTQGPSAADVAKVKEELTRAREVEVKQNSYWLANIMAREQAGEDIRGLLGAYDAMLKALTPALIQEAAKKYIDMNNYARFVHLPEVKTTP
jgi:zinc protease